MTTGGGAPGRVAGVILDVDGVIVDSPHEHAWREALRELMEGPWAGLRDATRWTPGGFTAEVYARHVSGRPRLDGARAALAHFGVPDARARASAYAARKQRMVVALIAAGRFAPHPDALRFVRAVRAAGMSVAVASSSENAGRMLAGIRLDGSRRLADLIDADVSGRRPGRGKPHPDIFLAAAGALGLAPERCLVVEDAAAGVRAARAGGMTALAVARAGDAELLAEAGADLVVASLDEVDLDALAAGSLVARP